MKQPERGNVHECAEAALGSCGNTSAGWGPVTGELLSGGRQSRPVVGDRHCAFSGFDRAEQAREVAGQLTDPAARNAVAAAQRHLGGVG